MTFAGSLWLLAALAAASVLLGRLLAGAIGLDLLRRFTPTSAAASAILGTASLVVAFGWLTLARVPASRTVAVFLALSVVLLALTWAQGRIDVLRPRGPAPAWLALLLPSLATAVLSQLPVLRSGDFTAGNDTYIYCAFSEWLQRSGLGAPIVWDPLSPISYIPHLYERSGLRLGAAYALALVQAATDAPSSLLVYPAVSAWGLLLEQASLFLILRWGLRLSRGWTGGALLAFAALPHPGYWSHHSGFLSQLYGQAGLLFGIAVAGRVLYERNRRGPMAVVIGLITAFLVSVYLPLVPVLAAVGAFAAWVALRRAHRRRSLASCLGFLGSTLAITVLLAHRDLMVLVKGLPLMASMRVGAPALRASRDRLAFAMGALPVPPVGSLSDQSTASLPVVAVAVVASSLVVLGVLRAARLPAARTVLVGFLALAGALAYYALLVRDPWTQEVGHSWNVFKLLQWMHPMVFLFQAAGAFRLFQALKSAPVAAAGLPLLLAASLAPQHGQWSRPERGSLRRVTGASRPLEQVAAMKESLGRLPEGTLLLAGRPADRDSWLGYYVALLSFPRPILVDWEGSDYTGRHAADPWAHLPSEPLILVACPPAGPAAPPLEELGGGCMRLAMDQPLVVGVRGRFKLRQQSGPMHLLVFSPREIDGDLVLEAQPAGSGLLPSALVEGQRVGQLRAVSATQWRVPVRLRPGLTRIELHPDGVQPSPPLSVGEVRFEPGPAEPRPR